LTSTVGTPPRRLATGFGEPGGRGPAPFPGTAPLTCRGVPSRVHLPRRGRGFAVHTAGCCSLEAGASPFRQRPSLAAADAGRPGSWSRLPVPTPVVGALRRSVVSRGAVVAVRLKGRHFPEVTRRPWSTASSPSTGLPAPPPPPRRNCRSADASRALPSPSSPISIIPKRRKLSHSRPGGGTAYADGP